MTSHAWSEIKAVLADVLEADPTERPAVLDRLCAGDLTLRAIGWNRLGEAFRFAAWKQCLASQVGGTTPAPSSGGSCRRALSGIGGPFS